MACYALVASGLHNPERLFTAAINFQHAAAAAQYRLRGSDAVYAAVALRFGSVLVTLDREQRERLEEIVTSRYPTEILAEVK